MAATTFTAPASPTNPVGARTTASGKAQSACLVVDGTDSAVPADATTGLVVNAATVAALLGALTSPAAGSVNAQLAALAAALGVGTYVYAAGTAAGTASVPGDGRARRVLVLADSGGATITIAGGATITLPAGGFFDEQIPGNAPLGGDVVIGGDPATWYVAWTVA